MKQIKKTHRLFAMTLAVIMAFGLVIFTPDIALANAPTLELAVVTPADGIAAGNTVTLEVRIANNPAFGTLNYRLDFDSDVITNFRRTDGTVGTGLTGAPGFSAGVDTGWQTFMVNDGMDGQTGNGSVSVYTFVVAAGTAADVPIDITLVPVRALNPDGMTITFALEGATQNLTTVPAVVNPTGLTRVTPATAATTMATGATGVFTVELDPDVAELGTHEIVWTHTGAVASLAAPTAGGRSVVATAAATTGGGTVRATLNTAAGAPLGYVEWAVTVREADPANVTINTEARWGLQEVTVTVENVTGRNITNGYIVVTTNAPGAVPSLVVLRGINLVNGEEDTFDTNLFVRPGTVLAAWVMPSIPAAGPSDADVLHNYNIGDAVLIAR